MKKISVICLLIALGCSLVTVNSCCKKPKILEINYPLVDTGIAPAITLPPGLGGIYLNSVYVRNVGSDFKTQIKSQGIDTSQVTSVKCKEMKMDITAPAGTTFGFIDSLTAIIAYKDSTFPVVLGTKGDVPDTATRVELVMKDQELRSYILQDSFKVIIGGKLSNAGVNLPQGVNLRFATSFVGYYLK